MSDDRPEIHWRETDDGHATQHGDRVRKSSPSSWTAEVIIDGVLFALVGPTGRLCSFRSSHGAMVAVATWRNFPGVSERRPRGTWMVKGEVAA